MATDTEQSPTDDDHPLARAKADTIVAEAAATYFDGCRARVGPFVARTFSLRGTLSLHREALGLDLLKAPANVVLSIPQIGLNLAAFTARRMGRRRAAAWLAHRNLLFETSVMRELRWRIVTELLQQPMQDGAREADTDALAEAIVAHPQVASMVADAAKAVGAQRDDPAFKARLEATLAEYATTRAAASDIATALIALGTGAIVFQQATPGAIVLGPLIAGALAQQIAIARFPLGSWAGALWYGLFPATSSPLAVVATTAGLLGLAALASTFAGVLVDPVLRRIGFHERRFHKLIDRLERGFHDEGAAGFQTYDLYAARLMDLGDALLAVARAFRG